MSLMSQDIEILRRASLISHLSEQRENSILYLEKVKHAPKDSFFICRIFFLFMGFMVIMPLVFFGSAANYWLWKFRNVTDTSQDPSHRTSLQSLYQSITMVASSVPSVICTFITMVHGKKLDARLASIWSLMVIFCIFVNFTAFTNINTDSWQMGFFITTMILLGVNNAALAIFQIVTSTILAKFPQDFMFAYLLGQSGGVVSDLLQVVSITVTDSDKDGALIYFLTGTVLVIITICLFIGVKYTKIYQYYAENDTNVQKDETLSWEETKSVLKLIWPLLLMINLTILNLTCVQPSITSLVVSENDADGSTWSKKYFTPVITFLLSDLSGIFGNFIRIGTITESNYPFWIGATILRLIISVPFILFCNAQPRHHLSVIFNKDWHYILFNILFSMSGIYLMNVPILSLNSMSGGQPELALKLSSLTFAVSAAVYSANGIGLVQLL